MYPLPVGMGPAPFPCKKNGDKIPPRGKDQGNGTIKRIVISWTPSTKFKDYTFVQSECLSAGYSFFYIPHATKCCEKGSETITFGNCGDDDDDSSHFEHCFKTLSTGDLV